jgi:Rab GDP dissociation inhibitor
MDEEYDIIALGTGLKECILSGLMSSVAKKKVLHMDRNPFYGGETASLNLEQLYKKFRGETKAPEHFGRSRDYSIDLCPKFIMACGDLVKILLSTKVTAYLEFQSVNGSFVAQGDKGKLSVHRVPSTPKEAMASGLMGMFQKMRYKSFVEWINNYDETDPKTHSGLDCTKATSAQVFTHWKLEPETILFTGHAVALQLDDDYLQRPAIEMINKVKLYAYSVSRYGNSPYIYPKWGLGGLPEGFSRRCAVHGGVYMLNVEEKANFVEKVLFDATGRVTGVMSEGKSARCKQLIADPSYFKGTDKVKAQGQVARCICILDHTIPNTNDCDSCQIIIPGSAVGRKSDTYISMVSSVHNVAAKGKFIAVISTNAEGKEPEKEIAPALGLLGAIQEKFFWVTDYYVPVNNPAKDGCFITTSYDATSHFESCTVEVIAYYELLTGSKLDLTAASANAEEEGS